jgi:hypothetical protein
MDDYAHLRLHTANTRRAAKRQTPVARRLRVARTGAGRSRTSRPPKQVQEPSAQQAPGQKVQLPETGRSKRAASAASTSLWNRLWT